MMFFIAGGVSQQVSHVIKPAAGRCIGCNSRADLVEYEKVLKLFFVPVWRWKGKGKDGRPLMHCNSCGLFSPPLSYLEDGVNGVPRCVSCSREVDSGFRFCPFCGSEL